MEGRWFKADSYSRSLSPEGRPSAACDVTLLYCLLFTRLLINSKHCNAIRETARRFPSALVTHQFLFFNTNEKNALVLRMAELQEVPTFSQKATGTLFKCLSVNP